MTTINEALRAEMEKAISTAEAAIGQKAKQMVLVTERGDPIHYQFGVGFEIAPGEAKLTPAMITDAITEALKTVGVFVSASCRDHFVRVLPEINQETSFDTKCLEWRGYMRGTMIGAASGIGLAKVSVHQQQDIPIGIASV